MEAVAPWMVDVPAVPAVEDGVFDRDEVMDALSLLVDPDGMIGLRGLVPNRRGGARNVLLSPDEVGQAVKHAESWCRSGRNVYLNVHKVRKGTSRPANRAALTEHIESRRWLFVDIDPVRHEDFRKCSAVSEERDGARAVTERVRGWLITRNWPRPVMVDSGNGFYLLYRIDLPSTEATSSLVAGVLSELDRMFSGPEGIVDAQCYDSVRIMRLPGTLARKGPHTATRPHRMCRILEVPGNVEVVPEEMLRALAGSPASRRTSQPVPPDGKFLVPIPGSNGLTVEQRAIAYLGTCPEAVQGSGGSRVTFWAARAVVYGFNLGVETGLQLLLQHYNHRCRPEWSEKELRHKCEDAEAKPFSKPRGWLLKEDSPRFVPSDLAGVQAQQAGQQEEAKLRWQVQYDGEILAEGEPAEVVATEDEEEDERLRVFELVTLRSIMDRIYPEPNWIIPGILSEGLNILAGAPKHGKSILSLNLAMTIAGGGAALGGVPLVPSDVLYLSLEDKQRRIKDRAVKMMPVIGKDLSESAGKRLTVATDWPRLDQGGLAVIDMWLKRVQKPGLVIIDVWNRFCPTANPRANAYTQDADAMGEVKRYAEKRGVTALIVHHTRKPGLKEPDDFVNEVSGTLGLAGTADGILVLVRSRQDTQATLHVTGRDVDEQELVLEFDKPSLTWKSLGTAGQHREGRVQTKVINYLRGLTPDSGAFCTDIADAIDEKADSVRQVLNRLLRDKVIRKKGNAWSYPGEGDESCF